MKMIPDPALNVTNQDEQEILDKEALIAGPPVVEDADQVLEMFELFTARDDQEFDSVEEQADSSAILEPSETPMNLEPVIPPINTKAAIVHLSELEKYFEHQGMEDEVTWVVSAQDKILKKVHSNMVQSSIEAFLMKKNEETND